MARQPSQVRLQRINQCVEQHPGIRPADVAQHLELARSAVTRALPALEDAGYLLCEDERGRLWPFGKRKSG